jgi:NADPH:quinone reductase-like Zn-dependent oxidoreductase
MHSGKSLQALIIPVPGTLPQLAELGRLLHAGTVCVAIDSTYPLADARKAHEQAARGHIQGKIVLTVA